MLSIHKLSVAYGETLILRNVNLEVEPGKVVCLMGRNGVGKTTLMKCLMGLLKPSGGFVRLDGREVAGLPASRRARAGIALVPQGRQIFPHQILQVEFKTEAAPLIDILDQ